jgi:hypothetical protein
MTNFKRLAAVAAKRSITAWGDWSQVALMCTCSRSNASNRSSSTEACMAVNVRSILKNYISASAIVFGRVATSCSILEMLRYICYGSQELLQY